MFCMGFVLETVAAGWRRRGGERNGEVRRCWALEKPGGFVFLKGVRLRKVAAILLLFSFSPLTSKPLIHLGYLLPPQRPH